MFGKLASEALGLSDIGRVISPENYHKVDADDYIMHERGEKIFFLVKSKTDEYCFTNYALLHLDGYTAFSKKRLLNGGDGDSAEQVRDLYNFDHTKLKDAKNEAMRRDYASVFETFIQG